LVISILLISPMQHHGGCLITDPFIYFTSLNIKTTSPPFCRPTQILLCSHKACLSYFLSCLSLLFWAWAEIGYISFHIFLAYTLNRTAKAPSLDLLRLNTLHPHLPVCPTLRGSKTAFFNPRRYNDYQTTAFWAVVW